MGVLDNIGRQALQNQTVMYINGTDLAEVFGVQRSTLYHYEKELGMPKVKRDTYDLKKCCKWYINKLREEANAASNEKLNQHRIELTKQKAEKARIENQLLERSTIHVDDAKMELVYVIGALKDSLNNMAGVLANDIIQINDRAIAFGLIEKHIAQALNDVCDGMKKIYQPNGDAQPIESGVAIE